MRTAPDLRGMKIGRLSPIFVSREEGESRSLWTCLCECGSVVRVRGDRMLRGHTRSCGCLLRESSTSKREIDIAGQKFGRLTAIRRAGGTGRGRSDWVCACDCGNTSKVNTWHLRSGIVVSCGCLKREKTIERNTKHGQSKTPEYQRAKENKRRALKQQSGGVFSKTDVDKLYSLQNGRCAVCKVNLANRFDVDHVIPLARGGSNGPENIQLLCPRFNRRKSSKDPVQFMQENGFLI